jgi:N-acetylornithine carbamoyltransferase
LKRKRRWRTASLFARQGAGDVVLPSAARARAARLRPGSRSWAGTAAFIDSKTTQIALGDTPKEIGEIFGRYFDGLAIRHCDWAAGNAYIHGLRKPRAARC